jgi:hypothetical protein
MKTFLDGFGIQRCAVTVIAMLVSMQAWSGPVGPAGSDTSSAARASSSSMNRGTEIALQVARGQNAQPKVYGKTYGEWAVDWVRWSEAGPAGQNAT